MTNAELLAFLFVQGPAEAEEILTRWILQSRRFQFFMVEYKAKVRKKLRLAQTPESLQSLLWELDMARQLVEDPRCRVEYEKYGQGKQRSLISPSPFAPVPASIWKRPAYNRRWQRQKAARKNWFVSSATSRDSWFPKASIFWRSPGKMPL